MLAIAVTAAPAGAAVFDKTSLVFGPQPFRTDSPLQTVTLTNNTGGTFDTEIYIQKPYDGGFFEDNSCPATLPPAGTCTISVRFSPYDPPVGTRSGTLNASQAGPSIPLSGQAVFSTAGKGKKCKKGKGKKGASAAKKKKCKKKKGKK